jgi:hypothetical protein
MSRTNRQKGKCTCGGRSRGKARLTQAEAEHDAAAWNTTDDGRRPMQAYPCWYCGSWHIGHQRRSAADHRTG